MPDTMRISNHEMRYIANGSNHSVPNVHLVFCRNVYVKVCVVAGTEVLCIIRRAEI